MAGTISFGGVGSGLDTQGIVSGLVSASQGPLNNMKSQASGLNSANTSLSQIGSLLGKLLTALEGVDETREVGSYAASSSSSAVAVSASGSALPGSYDITVDHLATEQRSYSDGQASSTTALGQSGYLNISVAGGDIQQIAIDSTDTLENIASKINGMGLRVSASVVNDSTRCPCAGGVNVAPFVSPAIGQVAPWGAWTGLAL